MTGILCMDKVMSRNTRTVWRTREASQDLELTPYSKLNSWVYVIRRAREVTGCCTGSVARRGPDWIYIYIYIYVCNICIYCILSRTRFSLYLVNKYLCTKTWRRQILIFTLFHFICVYGHTYIFYQLWQFSCLCTKIFVDKNHQIMGKIWNFAF